MIDEIRKKHELKDMQKKGMSSFASLDIDIIFKALNLKDNTNFLDLGCGKGDYSINASKYIKSGKIYAVDKWKELANLINKRSKLKKIENIITLNSDLTEQIPLEDNSCDKSLMAMFLHGFPLNAKSNFLFKELHRVLKKDGEFFVVEKKKINPKISNAVDISLPPELLEKYIPKDLFKQIALIDFKEYYIISYKKI